MMFADDPVDLFEVGGRKIARYRVLDARCGISELHGLFRVAVF